MDSNEIRNKEISWLSFNERLLQEAENPLVPLEERIRFLGIFSSNLDEFFRVRVATLKRLAKLGKQARKYVPHDPATVLRQINRIVLEQQRRRDAAHTATLEALAAEGIHFVDENTLDEAQTDFVRTYFEEEVRPTLMPVMLDQVADVPDLNDYDIYFACRLHRCRPGKRPLHALIRLPTDLLPRFVQLPSKSGATLIWLDDIIRHRLVVLFATLGVDEAEAYTIKLTRDAELDIDDDVFESYVDKVAKSLEKRKAGDPVRFVYDRSMPDDTRRLLTRKLGLKGSDSDFLPGGRYHNLKDLIRFPAVGKANLRYRRHVPAPHPALEGASSILARMQRGDVLLHFPYQSFTHVIDLLREASIDPKVRSIQITLYRLASQSSVIKALINAAKNGKEVTAVIELQARFDEQANIHWSEELQREGVRVIQGVQGLKVHSKLILVTRRSSKGDDLHACIGTGNFNETTARLYSDHVLLTTNRKITREVARVFEFLTGTYEVSGYRHLLVSPFNARRKFDRLICQEIENAKAGLRARITVKLNNITDPELTHRLYEAAEAGVEVELMVRGMFSPVIAGKKRKARMEATGIIDRFLEHSRILVFFNGGDEKVYLTSADWMPRNLDRRLEVGCPIYDEEIKKELLAFLDFHRRDTQKARLLHGKRLKNELRSEVSGRRIRAQESLRLWLKSGG
ncbi:MAG: polyphosphate kinase 1 [Deltaproteobacteria bacterium]|nr:polyphosphate kinase 1 [Deltaproteobacteria bacterium]